MTDIGRYIAKWYPEMDRKGSETVATWRSPNEMLEAAKRLMLDGKDPITEEDWARVVNCFAVNIAAGEEYPTIKLMKMLYEIPLSDEYIEQIVHFQSAQKAVAQ